MPFNKRSFVILWIAGMTGIFSMLLIDIESLIALLPLPPGTEIPMSVPLLKTISLIQPAVILTIAVLVGCILAGKVGLSSPFAGAVAARSAWLPVLRSQLPAGVAGGILGGVSLVSISAIVEPYLSPEVLERLGNFINVLPLPTRLLYGGLTEEILLRWGLMTFIIWALWRLLQKGREAPTAGCFVWGILISSLMFAIGHFPVAYALFPDPTLALVLFVVMGNSVFGLIAGVLYWRIGLESAMIAHGLTHVLLFAASYFGAYF